MSRAGTAGRVVTGSGVAAAAAAGGLLLDRRRRRRLPEPDHEPFGSLRGEVHEVKADDGLLLHAEIDEVAPYVSSANHDDKATVVFVHGFSLTSDCWHFQRLAFRGKRRMVFYDQRSHGRSGRADQGSATIDQLGKDLRSVLDTLAPHEPVVLVGHSMGGMSIVALAEQHPELFGDRVVGLGLISTTAGGQRTHKMLSRYIPDALGRRVVERGLLVAAERDRILELARRSGSAIAMRVIEEFAFGDNPVPRSYVEFVDSMISATPLKVLVEFIPEFDALDKFHVVESFAEVPTWIMCGTRDKLTSIGHARKLHARVPGSRLVELRGGGHMPILEHKERVNEQLDELFEQADRAGRGAAVNGERLRPEVTRVGPEAALQVVMIIHQAFADRPHLDPPATALDETEDSVAEALAEHGGVLATLAGNPVGALLLEPGRLPGYDADSLLLRRVSVCPDAQQHGVARAIRSEAEQLAQERGFRRVHVTARAELPATVAFWTRGGYREVARRGTALTLARELPVDCTVPTADAMQSLGERLARRLRAGDLVILTGDLGAGKTTLTQGLGAGLQVRGDITSPTFVISRIHPSLADGPPLVHVDAYRLGGLAELDDLDLDVSLDESVTVVEWGAGLAEPLADDRLEVVVSRSQGGADAADRRTVGIRPVGARWVGSDVAEVVT